MVEKVEYAGATASADRPAAYDAVLLVSFGCRISRTT